MSLDILIVEDDLSFAIELEMLVKKIGYRVAATVDNSAAALEVIFGRAPDFILMDIDIHGLLTGIEIANKIKHLEIPVLFITSFGDEGHYTAARESNMIGYLVKPIDPYTLRTSIDLAFKQALSQNKEQNQPTSPDPEEENGFVLQNSFFFKKKGVHHKVVIKDILYIKSDENYCEFFTSDGRSFIARITLTKVQQILPTDLFFKIHRQYIIKLDKIAHIDFADSVVRIGTRDLPLSRSHRKALEKAVQKID